MSNKQTFKAKNMTGVQKYNLYYVLLINCKIRKDKFSYINLGGSFSYFLLKCVILSMWQFTCLISKAFSQKNHISFQSY